MTISIETCRTDEAEGVMSFIENYWSAQHILAKNRALFDWQYSQSDANRYNFMIARDDVRDIIGILGYIPISRYDAALAGTERDTIWLTTWMARPDHAHGLGLRLLRTLQAANLGAWIGTVGLNAQTLGIYNALGYATGYLSRFYLLNPGIREYRLVQLPPHPTHSPVSNGHTLFKPLSRTDYWTSTDGKNLDSRLLIPLKTRHFVEQRYLNHPFYDYDVLLATSGNDSALIVTRICSHDGARALRVVDFVGAPEVLSGAGPAFAELLLDSKAEYLDFYSCGLDDELRAAGLMDCNSVNGLTLPGHFEPFESENVNLLYSIRGPAGRRVICKGDADQDRPNMSQM